MQTQLQEPRVITLEEAAPECWKVLNTFKALLETMDVDTAHKVARQNYSNCVEQRGLGDQRSNELLSKAQNLEQELEVAIEKIPEGGPDPPQVRNALGGAGNWSLLLAPEVRNVGQACQVALERFEKDSYEKMCELDGERAEVEDECYRLEDCCTRTRNRIGNSDRNHICNWRCVCSCDHDLRP